MPQRLSDRLSSLGTRMQMIAAWGLNSGRHEKGSAAATSTGEVIV
jgi:hypothetical protein